MSTLADLIPRPFVAFCTPAFGRPLLLPPCQEALSTIPQGTLPQVFTTRQSAAGNNWIQVPQRYSDLEDNPSCTITIDLDGHSPRDVFVQIPYDQIRTLALIIIHSCVATRAEGGYVNYGLQSTVQALLEPTAYDGSAISNSSSASAVQQPDGVVDSVAVPPPLVVEGGYSKSLQVLLLHLKVHARSLSVVTYMHRTVIFAIRLGDHGLCFMTRRTRKLLVKLMEPDTCICSFQNLWRP